MYCFSFCVFWPAVSINRVVLLFSFCFCFDVCVTNDDLKVMYLDFFRYCNKYVPVPVTCIPFFYLRSFLLFIIFFFISATSLCNLCVCVFVSVCASGIQRMAILASFSNFVLAWICFITLQMSKRGFRQNNCELCEQKVRARRQYEHRRNLN